MKRFGYRHSHQSKITNYFEEEEKSFIDIEQNEDGDKSGSAINGDESKKLTLISPNITKGKRKKARKNDCYSNHTTT